MNLRNYLSLAVCALMLSACHNNLRQQTANSIAAYNAAAGSEVSSFTFSRGLYSWQPLGNRAIAVYTQPRKAYLLDLTLCPDLPYASSIKLSSNINQVMSGIDKIWLNDAKYACLIQHIRPVDLDKLHATQTAQRKIDSVDRQTPAPGAN